MTNSAIVSINGLVKRFSIGGGQFTALEGIDLTFGKGEFTGLVGPSGSGKTTLLNIIGSLDTPTEGSAIVLGQSIGELSHRQAARLRNEYLGFIFQTAQDSGGTAAKIGIGGPGLRRINRQDPITACPTVRW